MPNNPAQIGPYRCGGGQKLLVIAGPCVIENESLTLSIAERLAAIGRELPVQLVFKASFDKANRTSLSGYRGSGIEDGLKVLGKVTQSTGLPVTTDIHEAAQAAYAHEFIMAQPKGYDTVIGDKGCLLSGGQQQRLAIARAVLKNAPILLLDEATSSLDSESEQQIQKALAKLAAGRTVIAIAHRLSTVLSADQIIVMDSGRIKEIGTHAELLDKSGYYRRLYDHQFNRVHKESEAEAGILVEELV